METKIETLKKQNGDYVLPRTRAKAVSMEDGSTVEAAIANLNNHTQDVNAHYDMGWLTSKDVVADSPTPLNADTLGGHGADYFSSKEYVNEKYQKTILAPATAEVGQTIRVSAVDENGVPTAWEAASPLKWELINEFTLSEEDMVDVNRVTISQDLNELPFRLERALFCYQWSKYTGEESLPSYCFLEINNRYAYGGYTTAIAPRISTNPTSGFAMVEVLVPGKLVAERWGFDNWEVRDERYGAYTMHNRMGEVFSPEYEITEITSIGISNAYHLDGTIKLYGIRKEI